MLFDNGPICREGDPRVESSTIEVAKVEAVETWRRYVIAPVDAPHVSVGLTGTDVAPSAGNVSDGCGGAELVVALAAKLLAPSNPVESTALTR